MKTGKWVGISIVMAFGFFAAPGNVMSAAAQTNCPSGTYRMIRGYGGDVICVPYGQGSPSNPAPRTRPSDITGTGGQRSGSSSDSKGGTVRSAQ